MLVVLSGRRSCGPLPKAGWPGGCGAWGTRWCSLISREAAMLDHLLYRGGALVLRRMLVLDQACEKL